MDHRSPPGLPNTPFFLRSYTVKTTYSITSAQANLSQVVREPAHRLINITKREETVAYVLSKERMETILETMEILANPKAMKALKDAREGLLASDHLKQ